MENKLLKSLTCCSVAEKAEFFQALAQELSASPSSTDPILVRTATGAVLGCFVPADQGHEPEIDLNEVVAELLDPDDLVPISFALHPRAVQYAFCSSGTSLLREGSLKSRIPATRIVRPDGALMEE